MQAEGREWVDMFSEESMATFDYVFTDAMTWTDKKGRRMRLWMPDEVFVDSEDDFMNQLVDKIVEVIENEPIDIYVNSTFLPEILQAKYDELWTKERMDRVIQSAARQNVAIEINARYKIPSATFIKRAKSAGVKFSMGTNNADADLGTLDYAIQMIGECNLQPSDFFKPKEK
jgi:histidinol phosphatase-like PHP family hydrolase